MGLHSMLTAAQIGQARNLLGWRPSRLSTMSGLPMSTVMRAEGLYTPRMITQDVSDALQRSFEAAGVEFIPEIGGEAVVRLRKEP